MQIVQSKMGTAIFPYDKRYFTELERKTSVKRGKWQRTPYTGFEVNFCGAKAFLTYRLPADELKRLFPYAQFHAMPLGLSRPLSKKLSIVGIDSLRDAQAQIARVVTASQKRENAWFINLQTGEGKTILATYLTCYFNLKSWTICYSTEILSQWVETYKTNTDIDPERILMVDGPTVRKIFDGKINTDNYDMFVSTPTILDNQGKGDHGYERIRDLFDICGIGLLIYDEAHRNLGNIIRVNAVSNIRYQIYLSADYAQGDPMKEVLYKKAFSPVQVVRPSVSIQKSLRYTKIITVRYNTYPYLDEVDAPFDNYGFRAEKYMEYQLHKGVIYNVIKDIIDNIYRVETKHRILILFVNIAHVDLMYEMINNIYGKHKYVGRYHGEVSIDEREQIKHKADIIVATYSSFGTGLNTDSIKYVISTNQCNRVADNQAAGRARALEDGSNARYFMLIDEGFAYCRSKLKSRLEYLNTTKSSDGNVYNYNFTYD